MAAHADWPDFPIMPKHIAARIGMDTSRPDRTLRAWLRKYPPIPHARYDRWEFTAAQANEVVRLWREAHPTR